MRRQRPDCFLGLDLGTSGCRAVAIDSDRRVLAEARRPLHASRRPAPNASEQDPHAWWNAVVEVLDQISARLPGPTRALSVDATSSTLLLCDAAGDPCSPALMYDDRRATREAERIAAAAPPDSPANGPGSALAKLLYLRDRCRVSGRVHALHQADWIAARLSGLVGLSDENNALKLGYDPVARRWPDWMRTLDLGEGLLPRVQAVGSIYGPIRSPLARRFGLAADTLIVAGTTDSNAAALAAGVGDIGDAVTSLGSTLVVKVLADRPIFASAYGVYSHRINDVWLVGGASNSGGAVLRRFFDRAALERLSREIDPEHPPGLAYYPLPSPGERFPHNDPRMQPRMQPRPLQDSEFLHGLLDGIATIEADGYARLVELGAPRPRRVFTSGGGAVNDTWRRIRARQLGVPVIRAEQSEAAFGAALLARAAVIPTARHAAGAAPD